MCGKMPPRPLPAEAGVPESPMKCVLSVAAVVLGLTCSSAMAGPASGSVRSKTGAILPKRAVAYVVRDDRDAAPRVEVLLTDAAIDLTRLRGELDPHRHVAGAWLGGWRAPAARGPARSHCG